MSIASWAMSRWKLGVTCTLALIGGLLLLFDPLGKPWKAVQRRIGQHAILLDRRLSQHPQLTRLDGDFETSYRPIFLMHGIGANHQVWGNMIDWIGNAHPGTVVFPIPLFEGYPDSMLPLAYQVKEVAEFLRLAEEQHPKLLAKGYHLLCHSQGALTCRNLVQYMDDHKVHSLVAMSGPQMGVFGAAYMNVVKDMPILNGFTYHTVWRAAYTPVTQKALSIANLWHDPFHEEGFEAADHHLATYNGLTDDHKNNARRKANFLRLQKAVFLAGDLAGPAASDNYPNVIGIEPSASSVFGYFKPGSLDEIVNMKQQEIYVKDTIGLRALHEAGKLETTVVKGAVHSDWIMNEKIANQYVLPHLV